MKKNNNFRFFIVFVVGFILGLYVGDRILNDTIDEQTDNSNRYEESNDDVKNNNLNKENEFQTKGVSIGLEDIPEYSGESFISINNNTPFFGNNEINEAKKNAYEYYGDLDELGRATIAKASIDESIRPKQGEERQDISKIKPSGWNQAKYDFIPNGGWLYNRSHLIGYQLSGENDNPKNLITGTRHFNADSMLIFENMVADYLKGDRARRVLYRVTPVYKENELIPRGVLMEAKNVDSDPFEDLEYCVFIYNIQEGVQINYLTGQSSKE